MKWVIGIVVVGALAYYIYVSTMPVAPAVTSHGTGANPQPVAPEPAPWYSPAATAAAQVQSSQGSPAHVDGTPVLPSIGVLPSVLVGPRALSIPSSQIFKTTPVRSNNVYAAAQLGPQPTKA